MHVVMLAALTFGLAILSHTAQAPPTTPIVVQANRGFHWGDAAIGATAGFGLALALVGAVALFRAAREQADKA
jgi:hypothetical protein